jgi:hypothetical protein
VDNQRYPVIFLVFLRKTRFFKAAKNYTIKQAVEYAGWLGGQKRDPDNDPSGVKTVWSGLQKLYTLLDYRELFDFMDQV